jgi:hypothetical protein
MCSKNLKNSYECGTTYSAQSHVWICLLAPLYLLYASSLGYVPWSKRRVLFCYPRRVWILLLGALLVAIKELNAVQGAELGGEGVTRRGQDWKRRQQVRCLFFLACIGRSQWPWIGRIPVPLYHRPPHATPSSCNQSGLSVDRAKNRVAMELANDTL